LIGSIVFMVHRSEDNVLIDRAVFFQSEIRIPRSQIERRLESQKENKQTAN